MTQQPSTLNKPLSVSFVNFFIYGLFEPEAEVLYGGAEVQILQLAQQLVKKKAEVNIITAGPAPYAVEMHQGIRVYKVLERKRSSLRDKLLNVGRLFYYLHRSKADVYVQRGSGPETGLVALFCVLFRKQFVYMVAHEWDISGEFVQRHPVMGRLARWGWRHARMIVVQNQEQAAVLQKMQCPHQLLRTAYPMTDAVQPRERRSGVLWVGRAETWKQPDVALRLAKALPHIPFTFIMPKGNYEQYYSEMVAQAQSLPNVTFLPKVEFSVIDPYFQNALCLLNTSTMEGFPNTFVQAAKNGTPVLSLQVSPDGILEQYQFGCVAHNEPTRLQQEIERLETDRAWFERLSMNAVQYAHAHHDVNVIGDQFFQLMLSLAAKR